MKIRFKKGFEEVAIALKKLILLNSWDGKLLVFHDFPYCGKPSWSQFFTSMTTIGDGLFILNNLLNSYPIVLTHDK